MAAPGNGIFSQMVPSNPEEEKLKGLIATAHVRLTVLGAINFISESEKETIRKMLDAPDKDSQLLAISLMDRALENARQMVEAHKILVNTKPEGEM